MPLRRVSGRWAKGVAVAPIGFGCEPVDRFVLAGEDLLGNAFVVDDNGYPADVLTLDQRKHGAQDRPRSRRRERRPAVFPPIERSEPPMRTSKRQAPLRWISRGSGARDQACPAVDGGGV
jgi:hypothetical protein